MQIKRLKINDHLCLVDFEIGFGIKEGGSSTILIGANGTGKSTLLGTILEILMSFDSPTIRNQIEYDYVFEYEYAQSIYTITKTGRSYSVRIDDQEYHGRFATLRKLLKLDRIFPQRVIALYSGANNRISWMINRQNRQHKKDCRYAISRYLESLNDTTIEIPYFPKRKYNYCDESMTPIYLVAILLGKNSFEKEYLQNHCQFLSIESIDVTINLDKVERLFGVSHHDGKSLTNFSIISDFIDKRFTKYFYQGFVYASWGKGYFELNHIETLDSDSISILEYFEKLHTLFDAQFEVTVLFGETPVKVSNMSEGQRQLIKMLGMLGICKSEDSLVLMDEPDAHMNPKWKYEIHETMHKSLSSAINTQAIIATHDPLVINGVDKKQIRLFTLDASGHSVVIEPMENTEGLGIDGLLQSEYYGLPTVLDASTREKMDKKESLLVKKVDGTLNDIENKQLQELREDLENMYFARNIPTEQYYDEFVAAMHRIYRDRPQVHLSGKDIEERNIKAEEILRRILGK